MAERQELSQEFQIELPRDKKERRLQADFDDISEENSEDWSGSGSEGGEENSEDWSVSGSEGGEEEAEKGDAEVDEADLQEEAEEEDGA